MNAVERILRSPSVPHYFEHRVIGQGWYSIIEDYHADVASGTRFLVRRHHQPGFRGRILITDYITVRTEQGGWQHVTALYCEGEESPFSYHYDGPLDRQPLRRIFSAVPAPPSSPVIHGYRAQDFATRT